MVVTTHVATLHTWLTKESPLCGGDAAPLPRAFGTARSAALLSPRSGVSMANRLWSEATWADCRWEAVAAPRSVCLCSLHGLCRHALRGALRVCFDHACRYAPYVVNQEISASRRLMLRPCLGLLARHGVPRSYLRGAESLWLTAYGAKRHGRTVGGRLWLHRGACASAPCTVCVGTRFAVHFVCVLTTHVATLHTWLTKKSPLRGG